MQLTGRAPKFDLLNYNSLRRQNHRYMLTMLSHAIRCNAHKGNPLLNDASGCLHDGEAFHHESFAIVAPHFFRPMRALVSFIRVTFVFWLMFQSLLFGGSC